MRISGRSNDSSSISSITSSLGLISTSLPLRAILYARLPSTLHAEKAGGTCWMRPVNFFNASSTAVRSICSHGYSVSISVSRSKLGVVAPRRIVASYSLTWACSSSMRFVARPVTITITPVASGPSVPACPTFSFFIFVRRLSSPRTRLTTSNDVQVSGLST